MDFGELGELYIEILRDSPRFAVSLSLKFD